MIKSTPGPWDVVACGVKGRMKVMAGSMPVASIASANRDASYNARLIAAAPDMLIALKLMTMWDQPMGPETPEWQSAINAIVKATGEQP